MDVLRGHRPPVLERRSIVLLLVPIVAVLCWAAAIGREIEVGSPIDPASLILRTVALGATVQALSRARELRGRLYAWLWPERHGLAITPQGLVLETPGRTKSVAREDVLAIRERGNWGERAGGRRWSEVYVVTRPGSGQTHIALPPLFERSPGVLAERLMRWLGPPPPGPGHDNSAPSRLPSKVYDEAAQGRGGPGVTVIRHGRGWIRTGPWASALLAVVILEGLLRAPTDWSSSLALISVGAAATLLAVPFGWCWLTYRAIWPRKGVALVLTPAELLLRTRLGVHRAQWSRLRRMTLTTKTTWSAIGGLCESRTLVLERSEDSPIRYDEGFLGVPAEVAMSLCDAYRSGG